MPRLESASVRSDSRTCLLVHQKKQRNMKIFRSISSKILVPVIVMTILLVTLTVWVSTHNFSSFADRSFTHNVELIGFNLKRTINMQETIASDQTNGMAKNAEMIEAIKDFDRDKIKNILDKFESQKKCTLFTILDTEGKVMFRTNEPDKYDDSQASLHGFKEAKAKKKGGIFFESTERAPLSIRAFSPVFDEDGTFIGVISGGFRMDTT